MKIKNLLKIVSVGIATISLFSFTTSSLAAGTCAFSVGAKFSDIDTTSETLQAATYYGQMGYHSFYSTSPTFDILNGNFSSGTRRVESDILFISGHGRTDGKRISVLDTGIVVGSTANGYVGTNNVNWNTTKLVVYAGCLTAKEGESNHITIDTYRKGADTTLGWHTPIGDISHTKWLNRFNSKLASGGSFSGAFNYANSFDDYSDNRVKDLGIYGDWNYVYKLSRSGEVIENPNTSIVSENIEFTSTNQNINGIIDLIKSINPDFNKDEYEIQIFKLNEDDNFYNIDFIRKIDGFTTNLGYNIAVNNGRVAYITNNNETSISTRASITKLNSTVEQRYLDEATAIAVDTKQNENFHNASIKEQSTSYYYNSIENKKYYQVLSTIENDDGDISVVEYLKEI